jgi:hypothetical protein
MEQKKKAGRYMSLLLRHSEKEGLVMDKFIG